MGKGVASLNCFIFSCRQSFRHFPPTCNAPKKSFPHKDISRKSRGLGNRTLGDADMDSCLQNKSACTLGPCKSHEGNQQRDCFTHWFTTQARRRNPPKKTQGGRLAETTIPLCPPISFPTALLLKSSCQHFTFSLLSHSLLQKEIKKKRFMPTLFSFSLLSFPQSSL